MVPMKIGKQLFYNFYMKFMMWLDYAKSKFLIPWLREGRENIRIFTGFLNFSQNSLWIPLYKIRAYEKNI